MSKRNKQNVKSIKINNLSTGFEEIIVGNINNNGDLMCYSIESIFHGFIIDEHSRERIGGVQNIHATRKAMAYAPYPDSITIRKIKHQLPLHS